MTHHRPLSVLLGLFLLAGVAGAAQDVTTASTATELPDGARYTGYIANWRVTTMQIRLDRVTGRTWVYDRRVDGWVPIPCQEHESTEGHSPRYQIIGNNEELMLMDTASGRTWRFDRKPNRGTRTYAYATAVDAKDIVGWHLVR